MALLYLYLAQGLAHNRCFSKYLKEQTNEWNKGSCELGNKVGGEGSKGIGYVRDSFSKKQQLCGPGRG